MDTIPHTSEPITAYFIAEREKEIVRLHAYLGRVRLPFEDAVAASNLLAVLELDLSRWKALSVIKR